MQYLQNATSYLAEAIIAFAIYVVLLRFWMQWVRADFRNELGGFIISVTNPVIIPLRRVIPSIGTIDTATLLFAYLLCILNFVAQITISGGLGSILDYIPALLVASLGLLIKSTIYLFMAAIFISILASWVAPHSYHPILMVLRSISEPLLAPARRVIPPIGGLDLSPVIVLLFLNVSLIIIVQPLFGFR